MPFILVETSGFGGAGYFLQMREAVEDDMAEHSKGTQNSTTIPMLKQQLAGHLKAVYGDS